MSLDLIDSKTIKEIKTFLIAHPNEELSSLIDDINDALANDFYPREQLYKAQDLYKELKQVARIRSLDERIKREQEDYEMLLMIKKSKKGSLKK
jgi:hypothetical protein